MSSRGPSRLWITAAVLVAAYVLFALPSRAQYPGQITNASKDVPDLRAVAVLEWTGDADHPKTSRLVPVCIYDGQALQDAGLYLARPEPLALEGEVEYQLQLDGKPVGVFQIENSGREQGSWVGYGKLRPLPKPKPPPAQVAKIDEDDSQSDTPILHRKHPTGNSGSGSGSGSDSGSGSNGSPPDPDRPTLHKGGDSSGDSSGDSGSNTSSQPSDPDRPTLHKSPDASSSGSGDSGNSSSDSGSAPDPDRPTLHRSPDSTSGASSAGTSSGGSDSPKLKKKKDDDEAYVSNVADATDPDRPHLNRGKSAGVGLAVLPSLMGLPPEMQQEVAVSDVKNHPAHPWDYSWASPDDAAKMKSDMEDLARAALGLNPPAAQVAPAKRTTTTSHKTARPTAPPSPASLLDEQFRVFELAYGSGATMVLTAHTDGSDSSGKGSPEKFVTLIGQPDLYGNVSVLVKNVTDAAHLDDTPHMRLVDAVDVMADNRGELLFELRGLTQRQFALYRVLRGSATRIFVSGADAVGTPTGN
jgi:hypothetical protein